MGVKVIMISSYCQQKASGTDPVKGRVCKAFYCAQDDLCTHVRYLVMHQYDWSILPILPRHTRPFMTRGSGCSMALQ